MSYKIKILKDHPVGFWQLDDVAVNPTFDFTDILDKYDTYQDLLDAYEEYGNINYLAEDSSGCSNFGLYAGDFNNNPKHFPLSPSGNHSVEITSSKSIEFPIVNSYYKNNAPGGFGTIYYGDNDFTLECWMYPEISTDSLTTILGDSTKNVGIFYENGNIIFKLGQEILEHTLPFINKSIHIACVYSVTEAHIYIDGNLCVSKLISSNPFTNNEILLTSGPTSDSDDKFLIDDVAVYRYGLPYVKILDHYSNHSHTNPSQISQTDNGEFFEFYDTDISKVFTYSYPFNRTWEELITDDLYYDQTNKYIQIKKGETFDSKTVILTDTIYLPAATIMDSSKIEWFGDNGITVQTSTDGINYSTCINGESIPQYNSSQFSTSKVLSIKITITSGNISKYLPRLYNLDIIFYNNKIMYSKNGSSYLSKIQGLDFYLGKDVYSIVNRDPRNGALVPENSGFKINLSELKQSIEFFYTPYSLNKSLLVSSIVNGAGAASEYSWNTNGSINKTNIASIYVNGVDVSAQTLISNIFKVNDIHHVVINFTAPIYGEATVNYKSSGSVKSLYQYMSFYKELLDYNKIINHYDLYTSRQSYQTSGSSITLSENSVNLYNNDWLVIQNS
jgi:hypothetical protein